jgi:hypothetical protein
VLAYNGTMKILALADRGPQIDLVRTVQEEGIELICTLGDLDYGAISQLAAITHIPKIGVYGNHCSGTYMEPLGIINLHRKTYEHGGLSFGGFEGSLRYKPSAHAKMYTQDEAERLMAGYPPVDVFLSHAPPAGINDEPGDPVHAGFTALREYMDTQQPRFWLHGHTYPSEEELVTRSGATAVFYVYRSRILDLS